MVALAMVNQQITYEQPVTVERIYEYGYLEPGSLGSAPATFVCDGCGRDVTEGPVVYAFPRQNFHGVLYHLGCVPDGAA